MSLPPVFRIVSVSRCVSPARGGWCAPLRIPSTYRLRRWSIALLFDSFFHFQLYYYDSCLFPKPVVLVSIRVPVLWKDMACVLLKCNTPLPIPICFLSILICFANRQQMSKPMNGKEQMGKKRSPVVVVLEGACLETVKSKKVCPSSLFHSQGYVLLTADDHKAIHKKMGKDASESRPDICHQVEFAKSL